MSEQPVAGRALAADVSFGAALTDPHSLDAVMRRLSSDERRLLCAATIDPVAAQRAHERDMGLDAVDWTTAHWDRVPALANLRRLSALTRFDVVVPNPEESDADSAQGRGRPVVLPAACPGPPSDAFVLSPRGRLVPPAEHVVVNRHLDLELVSSVRDMVTAEGTLPENISRTVTALKGLLGLGQAAATLGGEASDRWLRELCYHLAVANPSHRSDASQEAVVGILLRSRLKFLPTSRAFVSLRARDELPRGPVNPNKGFFASDIVTYPAVREVYRQEESVAELAKTPIPAAALRRPSSPAGDTDDDGATRSIFAPRARSARQEREASDRLLQFPSMHASGGSTWMQRHIDRPWHLEGTEAALASVAAVVDATGELAAVEERLDIAAERNRLGSRGSPRAGRPHSSFVSEYVDQRSPLRQHYRRVAASPATPATA